MKSVRALLDASRTKRYHTEDVTPQTLADHSWGVALIVAKIWPQSKIESRDRLALVMQYALTHDLAESTTGDVPAPTKWRNSNLDGCLQVLEEQFNRVYHLYQLNDLTEKERNIVKWADMLELVLYCEREVLRGNTFARPILDSGKLWIESRNAPTSEAQELYEDLFRKR